MFASGHPGATAFDSPCPSLSSRELKALQGGCELPWARLEGKHHPSSCFMCLDTGRTELNMTDSASTLRAQTTV